MSEIVNLRQARKQKRRVEAEGAAAANRLRFGRSKAKRKGEAMDRERAARVLDGARLDEVSPDHAVEEMAADPRRGPGG